MSVEYNSTPESSVDPMDDDSDLEWLPPSESSWFSSGGSEVQLVFGYPTGDCEHDFMDMASVLLGQLGHYNTPDILDVTEIAQAKYHDSN